MSFYSCTQCKKIYEFTTDGTDLGYSREWCSPFCHGLHTGRKERRAEVERLKVELAKLQKTGPFPRTGE